MADPDAVAAISDERWRPGRIVNLAPGQEYHPFRGIVGWRIANSYVPDIEFDRGVREWVAEERAKHMSDAWRDWRSRNLDRQVTITDPT